MSFFSSIRSIFADKPAEQPSRVEPVIHTPAPEIKVKDWSMDSPSPMFGFGNIYPSNTGVPVTPYTSLQHPVFYAGVKALADDIARMNLLFERKIKDGWIAEEDHPVTDLLRFPNDFTTSFGMWHYVVTSLKIYGQAFLYIERDFNGVPTRLIPILPSQCSILINREYDITYSFSHVLFGGGMIAPSSSMIHVRDFSLDGGLRGLSATAVSQDALGVALAAQTHAATMFRDGTLIQGVLSTPGKLSTEGAARMSESWRQAHTGATNAHKVAVLEENLTYNAIAQSAEAAQLTEARALGGEDAARLLRIAQHKVGILTSATFSNIESQNLSYLQDALLPITENIQAELAAKLLLKRERNTHRFRWNFSSLLVTDTATQFAAFEKALMSGVLTINECRSQLGLPPDPDGNRLRVPLNTAPIDAIGNQPIGKPTAPAPKGDQVADPKLDDPDA